MALTFDDRDRRNVESVPRCCLERTDASLAEHNLIVSVSHDVLGCHQQLCYCRRQSSLEENGSLHSTKLGQKREVLHVASTHLKHICMLGNHIDMACVQ